MLKSQTYPELPLVTIKPYMEIDRPRVNLSINFIYHFKIISTSKPLVNEVAVKKEVVEGKTIAMVKGFSNNPVEKAKGKKRERKKKEETKEEDENTQKKRHKLDTATTPLVLQVITSLKVILEEVIILQEQ